MNELNLCRLFKTEFVFVESARRVKAFSLSAKKLMKLIISDVIIVQWPELALKYSQTGCIEEVF